jgi:hypothetical protein
LHGPEIHLDSTSSARAVWPFADIIDERGSEDTQLVRHGFGHYHETYIKVQGAWRISTMRITRLRVECAVHSPGGDISARVCFSQDELVTWLAEHKKS